MVNPVALPIFESSCRKGSDPAQTLVSLPDLLSSLRARQRSLPVRAEKIAAESNLIVTGRKIFLQDSVPFSRPVFI